MSGADIGCIHIVLKLKASKPDRETASGVHGFFPTDVGLSQTETGNRDDYRAGVLQQAAKK